MNRYPVWKMSLVIGAILLSFFLALPNVFSEKPSIQLQSITEKPLTASDFEQVKQLFKENGLSALRLKSHGNKLTASFATAEAQHQAQKVVYKNLGDKYYSSLTSITILPEWMNTIGLTPITKGLDLRGGVYLLLQVDMTFLLDRLGQSNLQEVLSILESAKIPFSSAKVVDKSSVEVALKSADDMTEFENVLFDKRPDLERNIDRSDDRKVRLSISEKDLVEKQAIAVEQNTTTLRSRMNSIGVAEPSITRQGSDRIAVQLPGLTDPNEAKALIQSTASLEYYMVDEVSQASGKKRFGVKFINDQNGKPVALKRKMIISGENIIDASAEQDQNGEHIVSVVLDEAGASKMGENTRKNIEKPMAVVYIEFKPAKKVNATQNDDVEMVKHEKVISVASIRGQFSKRFQTSGRFTEKEARDLAKSLRSGALVAPVYIIEERTVGPSAGKKNIEQGTNAIILGFVLVMLFMLLYYRKFGVIAVTALIINVVLIIGLLSYIGATLTLPGIAGIVLTMGMAVDANVLIFERIREEFRAEKGIKESINTGFNNAFSTIMDANITTLIAAIVLFAFGTGPIKGFAVTLSIGILTSMFTAILVSRLFIYFWFEKRANRFKGNLL